MILVIFVPNITREITIKDWRLDYTVFIEYI